MTEFNIKRILVPVDFSPASLNALDTAVVIAKQHDATIMLLHVIETDNLKGRPADDNISIKMGDKITRKAEQDLQLLQDSVVERFAVRCEAIITIGVVCSSIIKMGSDHQADMIVMGTHGAPGFKEIFIGSNAYNVVKNSGCPVLTIPPEKKWQSFKKVLFPVRAIPSAIEKYDFARKIIRKNDTKIKILGLGTDYEKDVYLLKELALQLNEKLKDDEVEASTYFKVGNNMAEEVLKIAALMNTDLIVITATIDPSSQQFFVGHYTQYIINHANFPVLSIRPSEKNAHTEDLTTHNRKSFAPEMQLYN